jgi:hypothetical protein
MPAECAVLFLTGPAAAMGATVASASSRRDVPHICRHRMRRVVSMLVAVGALAGAVASRAPASGQADGEAAPIYGVKIPSGYRDWRLISVAHEEGNLNDLRAILGNDVAIAAAREGSFRTRTAPSLPGSPGVTCRRKKTTKSLAIPNLSWPGRLRTGFNS